MKSIPLLFFALFWVPNSFAQTGDELNLQSLSLIQEGKYKEAYPILLEAAELNQPEAQYNLAYLLKSGELGEVKSKEAIEWFKKSSNNNFNDAHYFLMMIYGNGDGVDQDLEMGFEYALKCAENDDATCMWNVVNCYLLGTGVEPDIDKFKEWAFRLAKLPNPENLTQSGYVTSARLELAHFYKDGEYFEKDLYQSYLWYLIYNEFKVDFSIAKQMEGIQEIKELEKQLTEEQIKNAPQDAAVLLGRKLFNLKELYKNSLLQ